MYEKKTEFLWVRFERVAAEKVCLMWELRMNMSFCLSLIYLPKLVIFSKI